MADSYVKADAEGGSEQPPKEPSVGSKNRVSRRADSGNPFPAFLGGLLLGWLIAGAWGFDLFPDEERQKQTALRFKQTIREHEQEIERLEERVRSLTPAGKTPTRMPTAEEILGALFDKRWTELADGVQDLLLSDEAGFDELLAVIQKGTREGFEGFLDSSAIFAMRSLADREAEVSEFLAYALASDIFREDKRVREWFFEWGARFVAGTGDDSPSRSALHQSLDRHLWTAETGISVVLKAIECLEGKVPLEAVEEILKSPNFGPEDHGFLIKQLQHRGDSDVVKVLKAYVDDREAKEAWLVREALKALANIDIPEARQVLLEFQGSSDAGLRDVAFIEFFASERQPDKDLEPLVEFLNLSGAGAYPKWEVLRLVRQRSPELFAALYQERERVKDVLMREEIDLPVTAVPASFSEER